MEKQPLGPLKKGEIIGGFILLPFYLFLTSVLVSVAFILPDIFLGKPLDVNAYLAPVTLWTSIINLIAVVCVFARFLWGQFRTFEGKPGRVIGTIAIGYAILFGSSIAVNLLTMLLNSLGLNYGNANQEAVEQLAGASSLVTLFAAALCAPIGEECLFRGLIFGLIHRKSRFWAYAVSMAAFSLVHLAGALTGASLPELLLNFVTYLPFGFALAWVYERCRSIWASIALHFLNNSIAIALMLLFPDL